MKLLANANKLCSDMVATLRRPLRITGWIERRSRLVAHSFTTALQVGLSAGLAWWAASVLLPWDDPVYAAIGAVVAIGTGEDRMVARPVRLTGGMVVAVAVAGVVVEWFGTGPWQIVLVTTITTVVGRFLFNDTLARTYSAFHGAVIAGMGVTDVIPEQLIEASIGAVVGIVVVHLVFPPSVEPAVLSAAEKGGDRARRSLQSLASALRTGEPDEMEGALEAGRQVEAYVAPNDGRHTFGRQISRLAPARWRQRGTVEHYIHADRRLESVLLQVASAVRVAQPVTIGDPRPRPEISAVVDELDMALGWMIRPPFDDESRGHIAEAVEHVHGHVASADLSSDGERMLVEALREIASRLEGVAEELTDEDDS